MSDLTQHLRSVLLAMFDRGTLALARDLDAEETVDVAGSRLGDRVAESTGGNMPGVVVEAVGAP